MSEADRPKVAEIQGDVRTPSEGGSPGLKRSIRKRGRHRARKRGETWIDFEYSYSSAAHRYRILLTEVLYRNNPLYEMLRREKND